MIARSIVLAIVTAAGGYAFAGCAGECEDCGWRRDVIDAGMPDAAVTCDPLTQTRCGPGEKCTWIVDQLPPQYVGHIGCAPEGTANVGDACMYGAPGATGYDNCKKGSVCGGYRGGVGVCEQICSQQGGRPMCDASRVCVLHPDLFSDDRSPPPAAGICE